MQPKLAKDFVLKREDATDITGFVTVGGFTTNSLSISRENADITHKASAGGFREYLEGAGLLSMSASGDGVFVDNTSIQTVQTDMLGRNIVNWQVIVPDYGTFEGLFSVSSLELSGENQGHMTFSISLESAGEITFTAAV